MAGAGGKADVIVNVRHKPCQVMVCRRYGQDPKKNFCNPWTHSYIGKVSPLIVATREIAIENYRKWILGEAFEDVEPDRLLWILENLPSLAGVLEKLANEWVTE